MLFLAFTFCVHLNAHNLWIQLCWLFVNDHTSTGTMLSGLLYQGGWMTRNEDARGLQTHLPGDSLWSIFQMPPNFLGKRLKKWYHCLPLTLISQSQTHQWLPIAYKKIPEFCHWVDKVLDAEASRHTHYLLPSSAPNNTHYWWVPQHPGYFSYCFCPCYFLFGECLTSNGYLANPHRSWKPFVIIPLRGGIPMCQLPWEPLPPCWVVLWVIWWLRGSDIRKTWVWTLPLPLTSRSPLGTSLNFSFLIYTIPTSQRDHKN